MSFHSLGLPEPIIRSVRAVGYTEPTPIQAQAIPMILPGRDLIAASQTGSGKTAAFLLPILVRLLKGPRALRALVLVPTRELAAQVEANAIEYARGTGVRATAVYGGVNIGPQERLLRRDGVELLIATPGRLLDLHGRQSVSLDEIEVLVLDEADRMVDMGFAPDLRRILNLMPSDRQTLMFSATMPPELNRVAKEALRNPQRLDLAPPSKPASGIAQTFFPVPRHLKTDLLERLLQDERGSVIIFARTKHGADRLARQLQKRGHDVAVLHGDRSQSQRERALEQFRRGRIGLLVATDIASRGIDVTLVTHVINYDVPRAPEDYVHRVGRTGRMDAEGDALTLVSPEERGEAEAIERFMGVTVERVKLPGFDYTRRADPKSSDHGSARPTSRHSRSSGSHSGSRSSGTNSTPRSATPAEPAHGRKPRQGSLDRRSRGRM